MKFKLLDLYCKAGGTSKGYADAGFEVTGVDIEPQKRYPFRFVRADALEYLAEHWREYDAIAASPPCQKYTGLAVLYPEKEYPDLVEPTRKLLELTGKPYVIENVVGAPLVNPVMLCGKMFGLKVYRHRLFETNWPLVGLPHLPHRDNTPRQNNKLSEKGYMVVAGHFGKIEHARKAMGIDWMTQVELAQAIPPAYTKFIGEQLMRYLEGNDEIIVKQSIHGITIFL